MAGIIAGAAVLTLGQFKASTSDQVAVGVVQNATYGISQVTQQFGTVGIIAVMVIIISLIAGVFVYIRMGQ